MDKNTKLLQTIKWFCEKLIKDNTSISVYI